MNLKQNILHKPKGEDIITESYSVYLHHANSNDPQAAQHSNERSWERTRQTNDRDLAINHARELYQLHLGKSVEVKQYFRHPLTKKIEHKTIKLYGEEEVKPMKLYMKAGLGAVTLALLCGLFAYHYLL